MACGARGVASFPVCVAYASFMHGACAWAWACRVVSGFVYAERRENVPRQEYSLWPQSTVVESV